MKITSSSVQFNQATQKKQTAARALDSSVQITQDSNTTSNNSTASIKQMQLIQALNLINSASQSLITDKDGNTRLISNTQAIESITQLALEEEIRVSAVSSVGSNNGPIIGIEVNRVFAFESNTDIQMNSMGTVTTEDGRQIDFLLELNYQRDMQVTQSSQFKGNRNLIDPLVINLNGGPAQLGDSYFEFDLNGDGQTESLHQTANGTGFLVFDKNENGVIDDGSEMFGPQTGYGFAELSTYDDDGNGWIDENDAIFTQLSFMDFDENGEQRLQDIAAVGLGAISLQSVAMDYDMYDSLGNFQAQVARSGVALMESGAAVSIQEIYYEDQAFGVGRLERAREIDVNNSGEVSHNASPLTQFQFDNDIINNRIETTEVTLELPKYSNRVGFDNYYEFDLNLDLSRYVNTHAGNQAMSFVQETSADIQINVSQSSEIVQTQPNSTDKRSALQAYFQQKIKTQYQGTFNNQSTSKLNNESKESIDVKALDQSVNWDYSQSFFKTENSQDKKLNDLKLLVENLKVIRERQIQMQEKLHIYQEIGLSKP